MSDPIIIGAATSIITELSKFIPFIKNDPFIQAVLAIVIIAIGTFVTGGKFTFDGFAVSLITAYTGYKAVVQPAAAKVGSRTQV